MTTPIASPLLSIPEQPKPPKAQDAAKQFEALLIGQMLRSVRESEEDDDSTGATMLDVADQQFAQMLASNGGMGLAKVIAGGLEPATAPETR